MSKTKYTNEYQTEEMWKKESCHVFSFVVLLFCCSSNNNTYEYNIKYDACRI